MYCVYTFFSRERLDVSPLPEFANPIPTATAYEAGFLWGKIHPDYDLVLLTQRLNGPLTRDGVVMLRAGSFVDVDIRGGIGTDPVTIQRAEIEVQRIGNAARTELVAQAAAGSKPLLIYHYYVADLIDGRGTIPYGVLEDEDRKLSDSRWPRKPVIKAEEEHTVRSVIGFRDSGVYEVQIVLVTRVRLGCEKRIPLLAQPMKVLALDASKDVTWVTYGAPNSAGVVRKRTMEACVKKTPTGEEVVYVPVEKLVQLKGISGADWRLGGPFDMSPPAPNNPVPPKMPPRE